MERTFKCKHLYSSTWQINTSHSRGVKVTVWLLDVSHILYCKSKIHIVFWGVFMVLFYTFIFSLPHRFTPHLQQTHPQTAVHRLSLSNRSGPSGLLSIHGWDRVHVFSIGPLLSVHGNTHRRVFGDG